MNSRKSVIIDGQVFPSVHEAAASIGTVDSYLSHALSSGKKFLKGRSIAYAKVENEEKKKPSKKVLKRGVLVDGKFFASRVSASIEIGCGHEQIGRALKSGKPIMGHIIEAAPDGPIQDNLARLSPKAPMTFRRSVDGPLLKTLVTHRMGVYGGGPA